MRRSLFVRAEFIADVLTATRLGLAVPVFFATGMGFLEPVAVMLVVGWWTDFFDGRLARRAVAPTRLGGWDTPADIVLASAVVAGEVVAGAPRVWGLAALALLTAFLAGRQAAWCMLFQAVAYGLVLTRLLLDAPAWSVFPVATAIALLWLTRHHVVRELDGLRRLSPHQLGDVGS